MRALLILVLTTAWSLSAATFDEPYRPQFHFTPATNWMNDPNGMVYFEGEYHLFYQYNPFGNRWGHMSWGHAVSSNLVHWQHLPIALLEEDGVMIFSGSAVVDHANTSGFGRDGRPPLVAIYTGHRPADKRQFQALAFSRDRGRTWTKYAGNPVLDIRESDFRDPKVFWHAGSRQWVMAVSLAQERKILFYGSPDLKHWRPLSEFGPAGSTTGIWECPDLFPLPVEDGNGRTQWVLVVNVGGGAPAGGSGCQYFVGDFDGTTFRLTPDYPLPEAEAIPEDGRLLADFEGPDYGNWTTTGEAFHRGPARGALKGQMAVSGYQGQGLVNSFYRGDATTGTLRSPPFEIDHDHLSFLIGGGAHPGETCMNLLLDGEVQRTATGAESEHLEWHSWDVSEFRGRRAVLEIVDRHEGGWGHVSVDHILLADRPARGGTQPALWADFGRDFYAAVSWSDIPPEDGRRIWIGWMSNWQYAQDVPTSPWRSAMTLPRHLVLRETPDGLRMVQVPVRELAGLRGRHFKQEDISLLEADRWLQTLPPLTNRLEIQWKVSLPEDGNVVGLALHTDADEATLVTVDRNRRLVVLDRERSGRVDFHRSFAGAHVAPVEGSLETVTLRLFLDTSSVEVFAQDGEVVLSDLIFPRQRNGLKALSLFAEPVEPAARIRVQSLDIWELGTIYP